MAGGCARDRGGGENERAGEGNGNVPGEAFENGGRWSKKRRRGWKEIWARGARADEERLERRIRETEPVQFELISFAGADTA